MKKYFILSLLLVVAVGLLAPLASLTHGHVKGVCKDVDGKPIAGAVVEWVGAETGHNYTLKTNNKGEYFSLGISPASTPQAQQGRQATLHINVFRWDWKKQPGLRPEEGAGRRCPEQGHDARAGEGRSEAQAKAAKEHNTVKTLNEKTQGGQGGTWRWRFRHGDRTLNEAKQMDATRDLIWFKLADAYRLSAPSRRTRPRRRSATDGRCQLPESDRPAKGIRPGPEGSGQQRKMAAYYNNLAEAYAKAGKTDDAMTNYNQAATLDPAPRGAILLQ